MADEVVYIRVSVTSKIRQQLKVIAAQKNTNTAEMFRKAMQDYLAREGIELDLAEGLNTWGGPGRKGKSDEE
jgi:hypothetical protein